MLTNARLLTAAQAELARWEQYVADDIFTAEFAAERIALLKLEIGKLQPETVYTLSNLEGSVTFRNLDETDLLEAAQSLNFSYDAQGMIETWLAYVATPAVPGKNQLVIRYDQNALWVGTYTVFASFAN